jgi:hypothetical protein
MLSSWPSIWYVSLNDLITIKEYSENLNVKLLDGTIIPMSIFTELNIKEFLAHVVAVMCLINQKRLSDLCSKKLAKKLEKQAGTLKNLNKSIGSKGLNSYEDQKTSKVKIRQTQEMIDDSKKEHNKAIAKANRLSQNNGIRSVAKMHESASEVQSKVTLMGHQISSFNAPVDR